MFDLDSQILKWRQSVAEAMGNNPEVIAELESHLRDDVQRLVQSGQPTATAWESALASLGTPQQLATEFAKVPPAPASWLPARIIPLTVFALTIAIAGLAFATYNPPPRPAILPPPSPIGLLLISHVLAITIGYGTVYAIGTLAAWAVLTRAVSGLDDRRASAMRSSMWKLTLTGVVLTAVGVVLGGLWAQENLGRFWGWDPLEVGGACVLAWYAAMLIALRFGQLGGLAQMLTGVIGNVVVTMSWFGLSIVFQRNSWSPEHSYGFSTEAAVWLAGFLAIHLAILGLAIVPHGRLGRRQV